MNNELKQILEMISTIPKEAENVVEEILEKAYDYAMEETQGYTQNDAKDLIRDYFSTINNDFLQALEQKIRNIKDNLINASEKGEDLVENLKLSGDSLIKKIYDDFEKAIDLNSKIFVARFVTICLSENYTEDEKKTLNEVIEQLEKETQEIPRKIVRIASNIIDDAIDVCKDAETDKEKVKEENMVSETGERQSVSINAVLEKVEDLAHEQVHDSYAVDSPDSKGRTLIKIKKPYKI